MVALLGLFILRVFFVSPAMSNPFAESEAAVDASKKRKPEAIVDCRGGLFLTYPRFTPDLPDLEFAKKVLLAQLEKYSTRRQFEWESGVFAREKHRDGTYHLHVHLKMKPAMRVKIAHADLDFDPLSAIGAPNTGVPGGVRHGNYQSAISNVAVMKYCTKDGDYIFFGTDPKVTDRMRQNHVSLILAKVLTGELSVEQAVMEKPTLLLNYSRLQQNLGMFRTNQITVTGPPSLLYLYGQSGVGKTTLATLLAEGRSSFFVSLPAVSSSTQVWWFDHYQGQEVMVFDNCSSMTAPPYDLMCRLVDSSPCQLPVKGGFVKSKVKMVIVTSILDPCSLWLNLFDEQMRRRLTRVFHGIWKTSSPDMSAQMTTLPTMGVVTETPLMTTTTTTTENPLGPTIPTSPLMTSTTSLLSQVQWEEETKQWGPLYAVTGSIPQATLDLASSLRPWVEAYRPRDQPVSSSPRISTPTLLCPENPLSPSTASLTQSGSLPDGYHGSNILQLSTDALMASPPLSVPSLLEDPALDPSVLALFPDAESDGFQVNQ